MKIDIVIFTYLVSVSTWAINFDSELTFFSNYYLKDSYQEKAQIMAVGFEKDWQKELSPHLNFQSQFGVKFEIGQDSSLFFSEHTPQHEIFLKKAFFKASYKQFQFFGGAINQGDFQLPLLLKATPFLSFMGTASIFKTLNSEIDLKVEQAFPSYSDTRFRLSGINEEGRTGLFLSQLSASYKKGGIKTTFSFNLFYYQSISNSIANPSYYKGNTVNSGSLDSFAYQYEGPTLTGEILKSTPYYTLSFFYQYLHNNKSPNGKSDGHLCSLKFEQVNKTFKFDFFYNESDSSMAYYNNSWFGHNDVRGFSFSHQYKNLTISLGHFSPLKAKSFRKDVFQLKGELKIPL